MNPDGVTEPILNKSVSSPMEATSRRIVVAGDLCLDSFDTAEQLALAVQSVRSSLGDLLDDADLRVVNLECPLTRQGVPLAKTGPALRAAPEVAVTIREMGFDVVTLANNHVLDYGPVGLQDTLEACQKAGLKVVGAGLDPVQANAPLSLTLDDCRLAFVNAADAEFAEIRGGSAGAASLDPIRLHRDITRLRATHEFVIAVLHGGHEHHPWPSPLTADRFRFVAEAGADAVVGHHSHVIGGHEVHAGVPIGYSLGNFLFPWPSPRPEHWYLGAVAQIELRPRTEATLALVPFEQGRNLQKPLRRLEEAEQVELLNRVAERSVDLGDAQRLSDRFVKFCRAEQSGYLPALLGGERWRRAAIRRDLLRRLWWKEDHARLLLNLIRCDAHREASLEVLFAELEHGSRRKTQKS